MLQHLRLAPSITKTNVFFLRHGWRTAALLGHRRPGDISGILHMLRFMQTRSNRNISSEEKHFHSLFVFFVSDPVRRSQGLRRDPGELGQDFRTFNREKVYRRPAPAPGRTLPGLGEVVLLRPRRLGLGNAPCRAGKTVQI